jgi:hypothetical protein
MKNNLIKSYLKLPKFSDIPLIDRTILKLF